MHWSPGFFLVTIVPHWMFGWFSYLDEQRAQHEAAQLGPYLIQMSRDTFENWQSELLQLLWQVVGLAYFLDVGSPSSKENDDRPEAKLGALLRLVGKEEGDRLIAELDHSYLRTHGHARPHAAGEG